MRIPKEAAAVKALARKIRRAKLQAAMTRLLPHDSTTGAFTPLPASVLEVEQVAAVYRPQITMAEAGLLAAKKLTAARDAIEDADRAVRQLTTPPRALREVTAVMSRVTALLEEARKWERPFGEHTSAFERLQAEIEKQNLLFGVDKPITHDTLSILTAVERAGKLALSESARERLKRDYGVAVADRTTKVAPVPLPLDAPERSRIVKSAAQRVIKEHASVIRALADR